MPERGVSTLVAMILVLAIVSASIAAVFSSYLPVLKKRSEIQHEERLKSSFLRVVSIYPGNGTIVLKLGGGDTLFDPVQATSNIHLWKSGWAEIDVNNVSYRVTFFALNLSTFNTRIPDKVILFSEGGIKIYQDNKNHTVKSPDIQIRYSAGSLSVALDNLTSDEQQVAGNGLAYMAIHSRSGVYSFTNVNVTIAVEDSIFRKYWIDAMKSAGFTVSSTGNLVIGYINNVNLTLEIRNFDIRLY